MRKLWMLIFTMLLVPLLATSQPGGPPIKYRIPVWTQDTLRVLSVFVKPAGAVNGYVLKSDANGVGTWQVDAGGAGNPKGKNLGSVSVFPIFRFSSQDSLYFRQIYLPSADFTATTNDTTVRIALNSTVVKTNIQNTFLTEQFMNVSSPSAILSITNSNAGGGEALYGLMSSGSANSSSAAVMGNNAGVGSGVWGNSVGGIGVYSTTTTGDPIRAVRNGLTMFSVNDTGTYIRGKAVFTSPIQFYLSGVGRYMHTTNDNLFIGSLAGDSITSGTYNVGIGVNALRSLKTASSNIAIGDNSLRYNTVGNNIGLGGLALYTHRTGTNNIAIGYMAGYSDTTGHDNIYIGDQSGSLNRMGHDNIFIGSGVGNLHGWNDNYKIYIGSGGIDVIRADANQQEVTFITNAIRVANTYHPASALAGYGTLYVYSDGDLYYTDMTGTTTNLVTSGGGGGGEATSFFGKPLASSTPVSNDMAVFGTNYWELEPAILDSGSVMRYRRANTDNSALVDGNMRDTVVSTMRGTVVDTMFADKYYGDGSGLSGVTGSPINGNADTLRTKKIGVSVATPRDMAELIYDRDSTAWVMKTPAFWSIADELTGWSGASGSLTSDVRWVNVNGSYYADFNQNTVAETDHPGSINFSTPSTSTGSQYYATVFAPSNSYDNVAFGNLQGMQFVLKPKDTGTDTGFQIGFTSDATDITPPAGLVIEKRPADTYWYFSYWDASAESRVSTGISYAASWQTIDIAVEIDSVRVRFNGVQTNCIGRNVANCPDATDTGVLTCTIYHNSTNIARGMYIDYVRFYGKVAR